MTSRDRSRRRPTDPLDAMIRWTLRERVGDAAPPPDLWKRIEERVERQGSSASMVWRRAVRLIAATVTLLRREVTASARDGIPYHDLARPAGEGGYFCLADQYGVLLRRLAVL